MSIGVLSWDTFVILFKRRMKAHATWISDSRIVKEEEAGFAVVKLVENWINPFSNSQTIVSISTARSAILA